MENNTYGEDTGISDEPVYENNYYVVVVLYLGPDSPVMYNDGRFAYRTCYAVMNKDTEVLEHVCTQLPEAIFSAVTLADSLEKAPWNWKAPDEPLEVH